MLPAWFPDTVTPDLDRALHYTLLWGLEGVVLRRFGGPAERVPHVNEARLRRRLEEHEVAVAAIDPGLFEAPAMPRASWMNELELLEEAAAFGRRVGGGRVVLGSLPGLEVAEAGEALRRAAGVARRHGQRLALRNETGARPSAAAVAEVLAAAEHPAVGACWDPAAALEAGEAPEAGLEALAGRVEAVVVRGPTLGAGEIPWRALLLGLRRQGFAGPLCLDFGGVPPKEALRISTSLLHLLREVGRDEPEA